MIICNTYRRSNKHELFTQSYPSFLPSFSKPSITTLIYLKKNCNGRKVPLPNPCLTD